MNLAELHRNIADHFNLSELQSLCFDLDIDYENLGGANKIDKIRELITYLQRRGNLDELVVYCTQLRPNVGWRELTDPSPLIQESKGTNVTTILFLAADPSDAARLRLGEELREIQSQMQLAKLRDRFTLHERMSVRPVDISQALLDVQPQMVHFSGHGTSTGALCFESQSGTLHPIEADALAALFEQFADQVKCVLLNACYSETQAEAIAKHIEYVIGMNQAIGDKAAIAFAVGFYQASGAGRSIEEAYKLGCVQIRLQGIPEYLTPVLIKKRAL